MSDFDLNLETKHPGNDGFTPRGPDGWLTNKRDLLLASEITNGP